MQTHCPKCQRNWMTYSSAAQCPYCEVLLVEVASEAQQSSGVRISDGLDRSGYDRLWLWFGISRAGWITLPRVLAHEMPDDWQDKMAALLEQYEATYTNWPDGIGSRVMITKSGKLTSCHKWLNNYRYPDYEKIGALRSNGTATRHHEPVKG